MFKSLLCGQLKHEYSVDQVAVLCRFRSGRPEVVAPLRD